LFFGLMKVCLFVYLGHHGILSCMAFSLFIDVSLVEVTSAQRGLDRYSFLNYCFHCAYK
jgi:hypothetical protein